MKREPPERLALALTALSASVLAGYVLPGGGFPDPGGSAIGWKGSGAGEGETSIMRRRLKARDCNHVLLLMAMAFAMAALATGCGNRDEPATTLFRRLGAVHPPGGRVGTPARSKADRVSLG